MQFAFCKIFFPLALFSSMAVSLTAQINPDWITPQKPLRIAGNAYYVGSRDLAAFLFVTPAGNILVNANLESSPPLIRASVEALGFQWKDTRILLNGQAHYDHVAGAAAIRQQTGANVMAMESDASVMESGGATDFAHLPQFPAVHVDRVLHDGDSVTLGGTTLVAHKTAGHTRGCTTWTADVNESGRILHLVIVGGWSVLDSYRLLASSGHPASYHGIASDFERTFQVLRALPCDIFLGAHGSYFGMLEKLKQLPARGLQVWIDPAGYRRGVAEAQAAFEKRLATER